MCTAVADQTAGEQTEIHERGHLVTEAELELFEDKLLYLAMGAQVFVFSGSLPRGVESDVYAPHITELRKLGVTTVLDSEGDAMLLGTRAEAGVVSPNE